MDKMKRFIDIHIPITSCNLRCHYCYVGQTGSRNSEPVKFEYSAEHIQKALTCERLGGICHFNMCGLGETLIPVEIIDIIKRLLENGHYIMVVTNGLLTERFKTLAELPEELRKRLGFKFSFHYLELLRINAMDVFFDNVQRVKAAGMSFSVEVTPSDELIPYIEDLKRITLEKLGAYCHITIPRIESRSDMPLLSKYSLEEFVDIWKVFDSQLLEFKASTWQVKRKEFCYAGCWSGLLDIGSGIFSPCYGSKAKQNIFKDITKPIKFIPVGRNCRMPHCYNSHSFLSLGNIPSINTYRYSQLRNRVCSDNSEWLNADMKQFLSCRLEDNNTIFNKEEEDNAAKEYRKLEMKYYLVDVPKKIIKYGPKKTIKKAVKKLVK